MPPPLVEFHQVGKSFGSGPPVLEAFNLSVLEGEFISLIGPSGCGKSTLLRLLSGLTPASSGRLLIQNRPPEQAENLAYIFQDPTLLPWLNVRRNVESLLRLRHCPADQRARLRDSALHVVRLTDKADAYPRQLSGGQKMRVSIARALTLQPRLLLLDEPFGALDEMSRDRLNEELLAIRDEQQWTAFFVTHSVSEAVFLSTRILILSANPGRIAHDIPVPLPTPRTDALRRTDAFLRLVAEVSARLRSVEPASPVT